MRVLRFCESTWRRRIEKRDTKIKILLAKIRTHSRWKVVADNRKQRIEILERALVANHEVIQALSELKFSPQQDPEKLRAYDKAAKKAGPLNASSTLKRMGSRPPILATPGEPTL